jgi:hypothetical protein
MEQEIATDQAHAGEEDGEGNPVKIITTNQPHAGEEDGEGDPVVDPEGDVVGGRLVLLEEVVLHPAHHVHGFVLLICLQVRSRGGSQRYVSFQEKVSRNGVAKFCEAGAKAETSFIGLLKEDGQLKRHTGT